MSAGREPSDVLPELMLGQYMTPERHCLARAALGFTAYLDAPASWAHGGAHRILQAFLERVPREHLRFLATSLLPEWRAIEASSLPEVIDTLQYAGVLRGVRHMFWMKLQNDPGAPALGFHYVEVDPARTERTAVIELTLPETWDPNVLVQLAFEVLHTAPVRSLIGGVVFRYDAHEEARAFRQVYRWASRYLAIDAQRPDEMAWLAPRALPGTNWLTYVGPELATAAEIDLPTIRATPFAHGARALDVADGVLFVAGDAPMQGDLNRMRFPFAYAEVARALAPWLADPPPELWGSFFAQRHTAPWFRRLIDPAAWTDRKVDLDE